MGKSIIQTNIHAFMEYLPYGTEVIINGHKHYVISVSFCGKKQSFKVTSIEDNAIHITDLSDTKLLLTPLEDITKEHVLALSGLVADKNNNKFETAAQIYEHVFYERLYLSAKVRALLCSWHYDIYNLIGLGEALKKDK